jgi:YbbR domain-containing protein
MLRADLPRKVVAFFFAVSIWLAIDNQLHDSTVLHNVPVMLRYDRGAVVLENDTIGVDITLRGSRKRLLELKTGDIQVRVAVPTVPVGHFFYDLRISPNNVLTPPGVRVSDIAPNQQQLQVDRIVTKGAVPIRVRFDGQLREGYKKARVSVFPAAVDVRGPSRILKDLNELVTEPVLLDDSLTQDFEMDVKVALVPNLRASTDAVHIAIEIARQSSQQAFRDLPTNALASPDSPLVLEEPLPKVSVTLHGPKLTLDSLDSLSIRPFVDITSITSPGRYRRPVQVWIDGAANVSAEYVHPSVVEVALKAMPGSLGRK